MAANSKLATAIHITGMLSFADEMPVTSESIAQSCGTNAVVIRRIIGQLTAAGLVTVKMGPGGGARLNRKANEITLADIYCALEEGSLFDVPQFDETHNCQAGRLVRPVIANVLKRVEEKIIEDLNEFSLAEMIDLVVRDLRASRTLVFGCGNGGEEKEATIEKIGK